MTKLKVVMQYAGNEEIHTASTMDNARRTAIKVLESHHCPSGQYVRIFRGSKCLGEIYYTPELGFGFHYPNKFGGYGVNKDGTIPKIYKNTSKVPISKRELVR